MKISKKNMVKDDALLKIECVTLYPNNKKVYSI